MELPGLRGIEAVFHIVQRCIMVKENAKGNQGELRAPSVSSFFSSSDGGSAAISCVDLAEIDVE